MVAREVAERCVVDAPRVSHGAEPDFSYEVRARITRCLIPLSAGISDTDAAGL